MQPIVCSCRVAKVLPPGGQKRKWVPVLARAAIGAGVHGVFMETHPDPENAMSDGPNSWPMHEIKELLTTLMQIDSVVKPTLA